MKKRSLEKRGKLTGAALSVDAVESSPSILHPNRSGQTTGLQQYFVDGSVSTFLTQVFGSSHTAFDPTAGAGHLLSAFQRRYGVEVDADQAEAAEEAGRGYTAVRGDVQRVAPLLLNLGVRFRVVVLNPPFGLEWELPWTGKGNSTSLAVDLARKFLLPGGVGALVAGAERFKRVVEPVLKDNLFAVLRVEKLFDGVKLPCVVALWREAEAGKTPALREELGKRSDLTEGLARRVAEANYRRFGHWASYVSQYAEMGAKGGTELTDAFSAVQEEYDSREAAREKSEWMFSLRGGRLRVHVTPYMRVYLADRREDVRRLESYHRQTPAYFALQVREWAWCKSFLGELGTPMQPEAEAAVEKHLAESRRAATPMYRVSPAQRIAFLPDTDSLKCVLGDEGRGFVEGESYPVDCSTVVRERKETREVSAYDKESDSIVPAVVDVVVTRKAMRVRVGESECFDEGAEDMDYLLTHFELPDPGDLESAMPEEVVRWRAVIRRVEQEVRGRLPGFRYRDFQVEDTARLLAKSGGVLAWEQGAGKSVGMLTFARCLELEGLGDGCTLFVMPQDLVTQFRGEARKFFGRELVAVPRAARYPGQPGLRSGEATAVEVLGMVAARRAWLKRRRTAQHRHQPFDEAEVSPVWAVTWYEALSTTGREEEVLPEVVHGRVTARVRDSHGHPTEGSQRVPLSSATCCPACRSDAEVGWNGRVCRAKFAGDGKLAKKRRHDAGLREGTRRRQCGYTHFRRRRKPAYGLLGDAFSLVCVDEGTKMKGDTSLTSKAIRALRPKYRVLSTGTPLKNFVSDLFWLLWWALGDSSPRFPYAYTGGKERFERDFAVTEQRLDDDGEKKGRPKVLPEISNLARLWRLLCSSVVRRRMEDVGCEVSLSGRWACKRCGLDQAATHRAGAAWKCRQPGCGASGVLTRDVPTVEVECGVCGVAEWLRPERLECAGCGAVQDAVVPLTYEVVRAPWGKAQKRFFADWLDVHNFEDHFNKKHPDSPIANTAMVRLSAAAIGQLAKLEYATLLPTADPDGDFKREGLSPWTPTTLRLLEGVCAAARAGHQVLLTSTVIEALPWMVARLRERGVAAEHATETGSDGRACTVGPRVRSDAVARFRAGEFLVLAVGAQAIALGHNLDCASHLFALGLPWDFATWDQQLKRVRRLTSLRPVYVHAAWPENSLGEKKWAVVCGKTASSDVALDGRVSGRREEDVDKAAVLRELQEKGAELDGTEVAEAEVAEAWRTGSPLARAGRRRAPVPLPPVVRRVGRRGQANFFELHPPGVPLVGATVLDDPWATAPSVEAVVAAVRGSGVFWPASDAHLYVWAPPGRYLQAAVLAEALGFRVLGEVVWDKPALGGEYFDEAHECLLFCARGDATAACLPGVPLASRWVADYPRGPDGRVRLGGKPALFYELVERRSRGPHLSLFAESPRPGWASWCPARLPWQREETG